MINYDPKAPQRNHAPTTCRLWRFASKSASKTRTTSCRALTTPTTCSQVSRQLFAPWSCAISPTRQHQADQKKSRRARQASPETSRPEHTYERSLAPGVSNCRRRRDWTTGGAAGAQIPARPGAARRREASRRLRLKARPGLPQPRRPAAPVGQPSGQFWPTCDRGSPFAPLAAARRAADRARPSRVDVLLPRPGGGPPGPATRQRAAAGRRAHAPAAAGAGRGDGRRL